MSYEQTAFPLEHADYKGKLTIKREYADPTNVTLTLETTSPNITSTDLDIIDKLKTWLTPAYKSLQTYHILQVQTPRWVRASVVYQKLVLEMPKFIKGLSQEQYTHKYSFTPPYFTIGKTNQPYGKMVRETLKEIKALCTHLNEDEKEMVERMARNAITEKRKIDKKPEETGVGAIVTIAKKEVELLKERHHLPLDTIETSFIHKLSNAMLRTALYKESFVHR